MHKNFGHEKIIIRSCNGIAFKIFDQHNTTFEVKPKFSTVLPLGQIADQTVMVTGIMVKVLMTTRILGLALGKYRR